MTWEQNRVALEQGVNQSLGTDPSNPAVRAASEMAGVGARYLDSVKGIADSPRTSDGRGWDKMTSGEKAVAGLRKVQQTVGTVMGAMNVLQDMANVGFANLTNPIAAALPSFPAATLSMLYMGVPHAHSHPPSLIPPAPDTAAEPGADHARHIGQGLDRRHARRPVRRPGPGADLLRVRAVLPDQDRLLKRLHRRLTCRQDARYLHRLR